MSTDKVQTGLRLQFETLNKITYIAKKQKRSLNAQLEYLVENCIEQHEREHGKIIILEE